jgi:hypothetical protein
MGLSSRAVLLAGGTDTAVFSPDTSTMFKYLWWAGGPAFQALGVANGGAVGTIPAERTAVSAATAQFSQSTAGKKPLYRSAAASMNSQPAWEFDGSDDTMVSGGTFTGGECTVPYSMVVIAQCDTTSGPRRIIDSNNTGGFRNIIGQSSTTHWEMYCGADIQGGTTTTGAHAFRGYVTSGSSDVLTVDGSTVVTSQAGSDTMQGLRMGSDTDGFSYLHDGHVALVGVADGLITSHGDWSAFVTWVSATYGLTIS